MNDRQSDGNGPDQKEVPLPYLEDMSNLDIVQNHLNETYFIEKEKEYLAKGGKPVLTFDEFEKFEK